MRWITDLITNPFLITSLSSWFIAQVIKVIIHAVVHKKIIWERLFGDGGMPSGHSATVSSLAVLTALVYGTGSFSFAVCLIFAIVVCHDATGVRQQAGKHAERINEIISILESDNLPETKLKELLGHTPLQVVMGVLIGIANAFLMYYVVFQMM